MKIKADENIGASGVELLRMQGHDVATVREQGLGGAADEVVFRACAAESRTLITLDRDFGQVALSTQARGGEANRPMRQ